MTKTKYFLYAFKQQKNNKYLYWYETDEKYFVQTKPPKHILDANSQTLETIDENEIIQNPWLEWKSNDVQKITSKDGICINYLKSTNHDFIRKHEDMKLLEVYSCLVENFDISKPFSFKTIQQWHKMIFETIYPFAGKNRTVNMSKGKSLEAWEWRIDFLNGLPELDAFLKELSTKEYESVDAITNDLAKCTCDFLFIHPFREGNGRMSRLICDIILAKNGFPMIGLKLKKGDKYLERVHAGYKCDYEPMKELLQMKIKEGLTNE